MNKIDYVNFKRYTDRELFEKLDKVSVIERRRVHDLVRYLLLQGLDNLLALHKSESTTQSADAG